MTEYKYKRFGLIVVCEIRDYELPNISIGIGLSAKTARLRAEKKYYV